MSGESSATPSLPFIEVLEAAEHGRLDELNLPDIRQSPFDTTFDAGAPYNAMPSDVRDVREIQLPYTFPNWQDDTLVRATISFRLHKGRGDLEAIAETLDISSYCAEHAVRAVFILGRIGLGEYPADELEQITMLGLRQLIADLRITNIRPDPLGPRRPRNEFAAIISDIHALERPFDGNYDTLPNRAPVLLEGIVESYDPGSRSDYSNGITVRQADGRLVTAQFVRTSDIQYGGSAITAGGNDTEPVPRYPIPGDKAQIRTALTRSYRGPRLEAVSYQSAFLLDSSDERMRISFETEQQLSEVLDLIRSTSDIARIRKLIGNHIAGLLSENDGEIILDLPTSHRDQLMRIINLDDPYSSETAKHQPMALILQKDSAYHLMKAFGKELLMMSPSEFSAFILEAARGERPTTDKVVGMHIYRICRFGQNVQPTGFAVATLDDFFDRHTTERLLEPENDKRDAYALYMVKAGIETLQVVQNQDKIAAPLVRLMRDTFSDDPALPDLCDVLPDVLLQSLARCAAWDFNMFSSYTRHRLEHSQPLEIVYNDAFRTYLEAAPAIIKAVQRANEAAAQSGARGHQTEYGDFLALFISTLDKLSRIADQNR